MSLLPLNSTPLERAIEAAMDDVPVIPIRTLYNEIGTINDIAAIGELTRSRGVLFHVDAAQSTGKVEIDLAKLKVDMMSFSAHKTYGPKGIGALYVSRKPRVRIEAAMHGGGHERGMRSGTLATHQIVGMGEAFQIAKEEMAAENIRIKALSDRFFKQVEHLEELYVNGSMIHRVPHNLNLSFNYVEGESLIMALKDLAVSSGSAYVGFENVGTSVQIRLFNGSDHIGAAEDQKVAQTLVQILGTELPRLRQGARQFVVGVFGAQQLLLQHFDIVDQGEAMLEH